MTTAISSRGVTEGAAAATVQVEEGGTRHSDISEEAKRTEDKE